MSARFLLLPFAETRKKTVNVFTGILDNSLFCGILVVTSGLQILIVEYGTVAFHVSEDGLDLSLWGWSILFGAGSLPVQQIINVIYRVGVASNGYRMQGRVKKEGALTTQPANGQHGSLRESKRD